MADVLPASIDMDALRARWGSFAFTEANDKLVECRKETNALKSEVAGLKRQIAQAMANPSRVVLTDPEIINLVASIRGSVPAGGDADNRALARELPGDPLAEPAPRSGNQDRLPVEAHSIHPEQLGGVVAVHVLAHRVDLAVRDLEHPAVVVLVDEAVERLAGVSHHRDLPGTTHGRALPDRELFYSRDRPRCP